MSKEMIIKRVLDRKPLRLKTGIFDTHGVVTKTEVSDLVGGYIDDVESRIMLRLYPYTPVEFPEDLEYIATDVTVALLNRSESNQEGIKTEKVDSFSIQFADDALAPYFDDIDRYKAFLADGEPPDEKKGVIRFL